VTVGNVAVTNTAAVGSTPGFGTITVVTGGASTTASAITLSIGAGTLTTGSPQAGSPTGITVSTTQDYVSAGAASTALGGQITIGTSLTLADNNRRGGWTTTSPVSIVFTPPSGIPLSSTITISTPYNYFATRTAAAAMTGSTLSCATACAGVTVGSVAVVNTLGPSGSLTGATGAVTVIVSGAAITSSNGAVTLSLAAGTLSTDQPTPGSATGVAVTSSTDITSAGAVLPATNLAACPSVPQTPAPTASTGSELLLTATALASLLLLLL